MSASQIERNDAEAEVTNLQNQINKLIKESNKQINSTQYFDFKKFFEDQNINDVTAIAMLNFTLNLIKTRSMESVGFLEAENPFKDFNEYLRDDIEKSTHQYRVLKTYISLAIVIATLSACFAVLLFAPIGLAIASVVAMLTLPVLFVAIGDKLTDSITKQNQSISEKITVCNKFGAFFSDPIILNSDSSSTKSYSGKDL